MRFFCAGLGVAGERKSARLLYLALTSRLLELPVPPSISLVPQDLAEHDEPPNSVVR